MLGPVFSAFCAGLVQALSEAGRIVGPFFSALSRPCPCVGVLLLPFCNALCPVPKQLEAIEIYIYIIIYIYTYTVYVCLCMFYI